MVNLHRWQHGLSWVKALQLAADVRLSRTDYANDQIWEVLIGDKNTSPLSLRTRYGGRVKSATISPQWTHDGRTISQVQAYAQPPRLVAFAPAFAQLEAQITSQLHLIANYWVMESGAIGGKFTIQNHSDITQEITISLKGDALTDKKSELAIITLTSQANALSLGQYIDLEPIVMLENGQASLAGNKTQPLITQKLTIPAKESASVRFVHAGLKTMNTSIKRAMEWLAYDWDTAFATIEKASQVIPHIQTGDADSDALIALSYHHLLQAFIRPTDQLPYASFVATRQPERGYSAKGDGSDYDRSWSGQPAHLAYLLGLGIAPIAPDLAQGLLKNFLATQTEDGAIRMKPNLAPQSALAEDYLCPPILARLAWNIYQFTEDKAFLEEAFPKLLRFYQRWMQNDVDKDTMPEWEHERQMGYVFFPTFGNRQAWAQNADIRITESPDMAAYMISEAIYLSFISHLLGKTDGYGLLNRLGKHQAYLEKLWRDTLGRYSYQDRDTNQTVQSVALLTDSPGDERIPIALSPEAPARVQIHVVGGTSQAPKATLHITGKSATGEALQEKVDVKKDFMWGYGNGFYTSQHVYQTIDELYFEGLSRVYQVNAHTVDLTRLDVNTLMPLMLNGLPENRAEALIALLTDPNHFWRASGMSIVSAKDPNYDPASNVGGGGTWAYWTTLIGEGLLDYGRADLVTEMTRRLLRTQLTAYQKNGYFSEFYHSDQPIGCGEKYHVGGIVPVYLLERCLGIQIFDAYRVFVGGKLTWSNTITISQHGVKVERTGDKAHITFASGYSTTVIIPEDGTMVTDNTVNNQQKSTILPHFMPDTTTLNAPKRVIIQVEIEPDDD